MTARKPFSSHDGKRLGGNDLYHLVSIWCPACNSWEAAIGLYDERRCGRCGLLLMTAHPCPPPIKVMVRAL